VEASGQGPEPGVLVADAGRPRGVEGIRGRKQDVLLVRHVAFELGAGEIDEGERGRTLTRTPAQPQGVDQRVVVIAGQGYQRGRPEKAFAAHVSV
jgi:hypothetical protein